MKSILLFCLGSIIFSSCVPSYYIPNMHNIPLLTQKGEGSVSVSSSNPTFDSTYQISLHTSYLLTNHLALKTNSAFHDLTTGSIGLTGTADDKTIGTKGQIHEFGLGYLYSDSVQNYVGHIGIWGVTGIGNIETYIERQGKVNAKLFLIGLNPTFSSSMKHVSVSLSMKMFYLRYDQIQGSLILRGVDEIRLLSKRRDNFIIEPAFTGRIGFKKLKFAWQFLYSHNIIYGNERQPSLILSLGLTYNFYTQKKRNSNRLLN